MTARVGRFITSRVVAPILAWLVSLWLIHRYLFALPVPSNYGWKTPVVEVDDKGAPSAIPTISSEFPSAQPRKGHDELDSVDPLYRPLHPLPEPETPFPVLRPNRFLPKQCLEHWFIYGELVCSAEELGAEDTLDATWLWVNGTDKRWLNDMSYWSKELEISSPPKHFREQNELMYSMRSVTTALKGHLKTVHLILYDYAFNSSTDLGLLPPSTTAELERQYGHGHKTELGVSQGVQRHLDDKWRIVQTPRWLNFSALDPKARNNKDPDYPEFRYASHGEIFYTPTEDKKLGDDEEEVLGEKEWKLKQWRERALPTFNSMAIESRIGWLPGLADVSVALNDDFFILRNLSVSDFHSPLFGSVIRFDPGYYQQVQPVLESWRQTEAGETGGLYHANYILSKRFPNRLRPYFAHAPKVITRNLHHEASLMFQDALTLSTTRRFREAKIGVSDIQIQWLLTLLRVERWREALLWTWAVANIGARNGNWDDQARSDVKDLFGLTAADFDVAQIEVHRGERWTMKRERIEELFTQAGWGVPQATQYLFSSMDGHLPPILTPGKDETNDVCILDLDECFGSFWSDNESVPATEIFTRLAFKKPKCGDCMIMALVTASGPLGLSAVFPPAKATFYNPETDNPPTVLPPPHLPLTPTWEEADFSLASVMADTAAPGQEINLREYCMYLLSRYLYISGRSKVHFHMLKAPDNAKKIFEESLDKNRDVAILGLNDDIELGYDKVKKMMNDWFDSRWPEPAAWERQ